YFGVHYFLALLYKLFHPSVKIFITLHGTDIHIFKYRKLLLGILGLYDYLICVSHFQSQMLKKSYGVDADLILCAGIDQRIFKPLEGVKKEIDFIFVGSFYKIKGVDIFIEALRQVDSKYKVCFVGRGDYDQEVLALKNNTQHDVLWVKSLTQIELVEYYNRSRFLVLPSRGDSFGLVVTESLFSGTPCIVSGDTGTKEQVVDGWNGFILEENQAGLLSKKMEIVHHLSGEEYTEMAQNALNSNKEYSLDFVCKQLNEAYLKMAGGL
ncbi:MAG: glycosyltransferase family 4 protein, partial [bacterium]